MASDIDDTITFWRDCFGAEVVADESMAGSRNVFLDIGGGRLNLYDQLRITGDRSTISACRSTTWKPRLNGFAAQVGNRGRSRPMVR
jgi:catechol 2,3-dioxygenase-like lactoylglutathione lyase family enzyme